MFDSPGLYQTGLKTEMLVRRFLESLDFVQAIEDVRDNPDYQRREIDYVVSTPRGTLAFEVKHDRHLGRSGNVLFELCRIHHTAQKPAYLGWSVFSEADYFAIWGMQVERLYVFQARRFKASVQRYVATNRPRIQYTTIVSDPLRTTVCLLVPLTAISGYSIWQDNSGWQCLGKW